ADPRQGSPGLLPSSEPLAWTTSSWEMGSTKFSFHAETSENVSSWWWWRRWIGSLETYWRVSCIQPMFHLNPKPSPPRSTGRDTLGQAVDSPATATPSGGPRQPTGLKSLRNRTASRSSLPPYSFGTHSPSLRE